MHTFLLLVTTVFLYGNMDVDCLLQMHFHGSDMKSLHKFLSPDILPEDYKGTQPKINYGSVDWLPAIEKYNDFVREWSEFGPAKW